LIQQPTRPRICAKSSRRNSSAPTCHPLFRPLYSLPSASKRRFPIASSKRRRRGRVSPGPPNSPSTRSTRNQEARLASRQAGKLLPRYALSGWSSRRNLARTGSTREMAPGYYMRSFRAVAPSAAAAAARASQIWQHGELTSNGVRPGSMAGSRQGCAPSPAVAPISWRVSTPRLLSFNRSVEKNVSACNNSPLHCD
jgi:hypothetical protein